MQDFFFFKLCSFTESCMFIFGFRQICLTAHEIQNGWLHKTPVLNMRLNSEQEQYYAVLMMF